MPFTYKDLIKKSQFRIIDVEDFLDPNGKQTIFFDSELGYVPRDAIKSDGVDFSSPTYRYEDTGERKIINYPDRPCRINTYGDSFTHCSQVSDGETWQERLAAHFGEPIRNFGCGGQSVYVAYKKALRMEDTDKSAENIILGIFDDDHLRNLDAARCFRTCDGNNPNSPNVAQQVHGTPWGHLRYDLDKGGFVEVPGFCKTPNDMRKLCDPDFFYETFKDDHIVHLITLKKGGEAAETQIVELEKIAEAFGLEVDLRDPEKRVADATKLDDIYGWKSNEYLLEQMLSWAKKKGKNVIVLLTYMCYRASEELIDKNFRNDQYFIDYLDRNNIPYIDTMSKDADHFLEHNIPHKDYREKYNVERSISGAAGHYNPAGNANMAFAIKKEILDWLNPKPPAYQDH